MKLIDVALSTFIGAGGCWCSIYISARRIAVASWIFSKADTISHYEAEATTLFNMLHSVWICPFSFGWALSISLTKSIGKWWIPALLFAPSSVRYVPSLCSLSTTSDDSYVIVPLGNVIRQSTHLLIALLVSSVDFDCWDDSVLSTNNGIGSVTLHQFKQEPMISCVCLIPSGNSFFNYFFLWRIFASCHN